MAGANVDWLPGLAMLGIGLIVGFMIIYQLQINSRGKVRTVSDLEVRDLEAKRDALLQQLRELNDRGEQSEEATAGERHSLEIEAARVLQDLDRLRGPAHASHSLAGLPVASSAAATAASMQAPASQARATMRGFFWGTASAASLAILVYFVIQTATKREEGGQLTGNLPEQTTTAGADSELQGLIAGVEQNPSNIDARLNLAYAHLVRRDLMKVFEHTQIVLARSPGHPRALAYEALVRLAMSQPDVARSMLKEAIEKQPDLIDAWIHLAIVHATTGNNAEAMSTLKEAMRRFPQQAPALQNVMAEMRAAAATRGTSPSAPDLSVAASADGTGIRGVIQLDPSSAKTVKPGTLMFVTARAPGVTSGAPLAVKRIEVSGFPVSFQLSESDSMMGQALPERVRIEARIDSDGDPLSRTPGDPQGSLDNVALGAADVRITLR